MQRILTFIGPTLKKVTIGKITLINRGIKNIQQSNYNLIY